MNVKKYLITLIGISFGLMLQAQYTDLKEYGLKGKVKTVTMYNYSKIINSNGEWVPEDSTRWFYKAIKYFNENGNLDSMVSRLNYANHKNYSSFAFSSKIIYVQANGRKSTGYMTGIRDMNLETEVSSEKQLYAYSWKNDKEYSEKIFDVEDNRMTSENFYTLNNDFRDYKGENKSFTWNDSLYSHTTYVNQFDKNGFMIQSTETELLTKEVTITRYEHKKLDSNQNPSIIWVYKEKETEPRMVSARTYEYY